MKTIGTDGRPYILNPKKSAQEIDEDNQSALHKQAKKIIKECLPYATIYEEVVLTGCKGTTGTLRADFFIPECPILVEVHGQQHYKFVKHFHKTMAEFKSHQQNDLIKQEWCKTNDIIYVELPFDKTTKWKQILNAALE